MSLSPARRVAREVVTRVRERSSFGHETLSAALGRAKLTADDASLATRLAYGALQMQGALDDALERHLSGKRIEPRVRDALRVATYEILFLHTGDHAAVHQGVELAKAVRPQAAGLANAVLRRIARETGDFPWGDSDTDDAVLARRFGHPRWMSDLWVSELGRDTAVAVMAADNQPAPLFLAINPFTATPDTAYAALTADGAQPAVCAIPDCLVVGDSAAAVHGSALATGLVIAADEAAQFVAALVRPEPGQTIVEVGAGRGTKTVLIQGAALAAGGPANLIAVDVHGFKSALLKERLAAYGVPCVTALTGDATDFSAIPGAPVAASVDSVLIDAPCTGLGTLRRHPEKRWRVTPDDIAQLAALGARLLSSAALLVRPGGFVVYSSCTLSDAENSQTVHAFLGSGPGSEFSVDPLDGDVPEEWRRFLTPDGFFRSLPEPGGADGHFAARLKRAE